MPGNEVFELHPTGWESDPSDEYFKLSTLDYCAPQVYNNYALFFKLSDTVKPQIVPVLKRGLETTLSQCRQLCGVLETHPEGGLCLHKRGESAVPFHVQWLDSPEADSEDKYPSFDDLEKRHFVSQALGDLNTWSVAPMTYGDKPEAQPASKPRVAAFKASFIRGGLVFMMHHLHCVNDVMGWAGELHQLAENCAAVWKSWDNPVLPDWDPACLDNSRTTKPDAPEDQQVDGPALPSRHVDHKTGGQWLLFHLPKSKMVELKEAASPVGSDYWISSYDAYAAYIWRMVVKHKAKLFKPNPKEIIVWAEAIDMRRRFHDPPILKRTQGNVVNFAFNTLQGPKPPLTVEDVISEIPLSRAFDALLSSIAPVRDKTTLYLRLDSFSPMTNFVTDWRDSKPCEADFGFAKPHAFRHPFDTVSSGLIIIYPVRTNRHPAGDDEGHEFIIGLEEEVARSLVGDPEWNQYFEFRGVDSEEKVEVEDPTAAV
ncbi:hypothetical protein B0T22DRAFT_517314 [Podospora appendiculata]|uniref:Trichothecene 3-O-acetyltransferase n=1 Tax=Podospora appendiculata TaxID=314037 RepID=A0AAE1CA62_9PEZI|nr:hypothetical protein B0T22DRAFT_517314 [Podospora appendiculata]